MKKILWTSIFILSLWYCEWSVHTFLVNLAYLAGTYLFFKVMWFWFRAKCRSHGGFFSLILHTADTTRYDQQIFDAVWNSISSNLTGSSYASYNHTKSDADQRVWNRTKAQNEAAFHQYYANQNRGTYSGYQSQNRANNARNRANRY